MIAFQTVRKTLIAPFRRWVSVICIVHFASLMPSSAAALELLLGTGEAGSFAHFSGRIIERIVNRNEPAVSIKTIPASGDMHNLTNLMQGSLDLALIDSRMLYDAIHKQGNFKFLDIQYDNLRAVLRLYDIPLTLLVRSDAGISSLDELKGKRINAGYPRSPLHLATKTVMKAKNWTKSDFSLFAEISSSLSQDTMAFCHGTTQAMLHMGIHPAPAVSQLLQRCSAQLLAMNDGEMAALVAGNTSWVMTRIQAATYPAQAATLETIGSQAVLVASEDLDAASVHAVVELLIGNAQRLQNAHPALVLDKAGPDKDSIAGAAWHPGTLRFFSQR